MMVRTTVEKLISDLHLASLAQVSPEGADAPPPGAGQVPSHRANLLATLGELYGCTDLQAQERHQIVVALAEVSDAEVIPVLIEALEDPKAETRRLAARALACHGQRGLTVLVSSIAFKQHSECFYRSAHHALYILQFQAPLRDRKLLADLLAAIVAPEAAALAPWMARSIIDQ